MNGGEKKLTQEKGTLNYRGTVACMLHSFQVRIHKELNPGRARVLSATIGPNLPIFNVFLWNSKTASDLPDYFSPLRRRSGVPKWEGEMTELSWFTEVSQHLFSPLKKQENQTCKRSEKENKHFSWKPEAKDDLFACLVAGQLPPLLEDLEHL